MRKKLMFPFFLLLGFMQLTFAECPYENVEDCPYYGKDPYGVVYHTCPYNSTISSEEEMLGTCNYYEDKNGWFRWNGELNVYEECIPINDHSVNTSIDLGVDWPLESDINKNHDILIISLAGSAKALSSKTVIGWFTDMDTDDDIGKVANNYAPGNKNIITISGAPELVITDELKNILDKAGELLTGTITCDNKKSVLINLFSGLPLAGETYCAIEESIQWIQAFKTLTNLTEALDERNFRPSYPFLADKIEAIANRMAPNRKIILIGKSMGGGLLMKATQQLKDRLNIDLLILVDASCTIEDHSNEIQTIYPNVKSVYSFYQRKEYESQNGYPVNYVEETSRNDSINIDVDNADLCNCGTEIVKVYNQTEIDPDHVMGGEKLHTITYKEQLVRTTHGEIDTCSGLLNKINELIQEEILSLKPVDISPVLNLLLD